MIRSVRSAPLTPAPQKQLPRPGEFDDRDYYGRLEPAELQQLTAHGGHLLRESESMDDHPVLPLEGFIVRIGGSGQNYGYNYALFENLDQLKAYAKASRLGEPLSWKLWNPSGGAWGTQDSASTAPSSGAQGPTQRGWIVSHVDGAGNRYGNAYSTFEEAQKYYDEMRARGLMPNERYEPPRLSDRPIW